MGDGKLPNLIPKTLEIAALKQIRFGIGAERGIPSLRVYLHNPIADSPELCRDADQFIQQDRGFRRIEYGGQHGNHALPRAVTSKRGADFWPAFTRVGPLNALELPCLQATKPVVACGWMLPDGEARFGA